MKKSLIALAVLAAAGTASAQSSVTLFGIVDATIQRVNNEGGPSVTRLTNSGYNSSRLGFRGTEDLGGGLSASFWLEAGLANDDGQGAATSTNNQFTGTGSGVAGRQGLTFNRRSTVSLAGGWGELRLGRDYTPQFWNLTVFDPFGTNGIGTTQTLNAISGSGGPQFPNYPTAVRASNSIGYFLPGNLGGFYGQYMHYLGENPSGGNNDGTGDGFRVGWANGPINVALGMSETKNHVTPAGVVGTADLKIKQNNVGAQWDFGVVQVMGQYTWDSLGDTDGNGWLLGGLFPIGAGQIRLAYSEYKVKLGTEPKTSKWALGYVHNLSKRTAVYVTWADVSNKNGAQTSAAPGAAGNPGVNKSSSGFDLGVRHSF
jgi:predicted porin